MTTRDHLAEVNARFPFDEEAERRLLAGGYEPLDPEILRGVRDRVVAATMFTFFDSIAEAERSGVAAERRQREAREDQIQEFRSLGTLADAALDGRYGADARTLAKRILFGEDNAPLPRNLARLRTIRQGLRKLGLPARVPRS